VTSSSLAIPPMPSSASLQHAAQSRESVAKRLVRRAYRELRGPFYWDRARDLRRTTFVGGTGRGGTTWLAELLNHRNDRRLIFEPMRPDRVKVASVFTEREYIRPSRRDPARLHAMSLILSGAVRSRWTDLYNACTFPVGRIVKDIRMNLMLGWLREVFPDLQTVLILRHPMAVALSRTRLAAQGQWWWEPDLDVYLRQTDLVEDILHPHVSTLLDLRSPFEQHVASWAIETHVALSQFSGIAVHYEELAQRPRDVLLPVYTYLGWPFDVRAVLRSKRPSAMATTESAVRRRGHNVVSQWSHEIEPATVRSALRLLELFGLASLYDESPEAKESSPWHVPADSSSI
jgi:Sulfotransferase family